MTIDEGCVKYHSDWTTAPADWADEAAELERCRRPLYIAGLVGEYADLGIGFGNLSIRCGRPGQFLITGTQTGHIAKTSPEHYALVTSYDIPGNRIDCRGPVQASSEAMTHAAIYELDPGIGAVVHVHSRPLWEAGLGAYPCTDAGIGYGTPEMAAEFRRLYRDGEFARTRIAVMAGHEEGLVSFGATAEEAGRRILSLL